MTTTRKQYKKKKQKKKKKKETKKGGEGKGEAPQKAMRPSEKEGLLTRGLTERTHPWAIEITPQARRMDCAQRGRK